MSFCVLPWSKSWRRHWLWCKGLGSYLWRSGEHCTGDTVLLLQLLVRSTEPARARLISAIATSSRIKTDDTRVSFFDEQRRRKNYFCCHHDTWWSNLATRLNFALQNSCSNSNALSKMHILQLQITHRARVPYKSTFRIVIILSITTYYNFH